MVAASNEMGTIKPQFSMEISAKEKILKSCWNPKSKADEKLHLNQKMLLFKQFLDLKNIFKSLRIYIKVFHNIAVHLSSSFLFNLFLFKSDNSALRPD